MKGPTHDYAARAKCGCVVAICYDGQDKLTAESVAEWIKGGLSVERLPRHEAVELFCQPCTHIPEGQLGLGL